MALRVQVPIHVRWADPAGLAVDGAPSGGVAPPLDALEQALARALGRALEPVREQVMEPRRGSANARPLAPRFTWVDPAGRVAPGWRVAVEQRCGSAIAQALSALAVDAPASRETLPARATERIDPRRLRGLGYRVHSYTGGPDDADLPADPSATPDSGDDWGTEFWFWDGSDDALLQRIELIARLLLEGARPQRLGLLLRGRRDGLTGLYAATATLRWHGAQPRIEAPGVHYFFLMDRFRVIGTRGQEPRSEPADGRFQLEMLGRYAGPESLRERALAALLALEGLTPEPLPSDTPEQARRRAVVAQAVEAFVAEYGNAAAHVFARLSSPLGTRYFVALPQAAFEGQESIELLGAWDTVRRGAGDDDDDSERQDAADEGRAAGEGRRDEQAEHAKGGSPLAEADPGVTPEGRVRYFPRLQVNGQPLELDLSPFLGEPNVNDIGLPGQVLKRQIQRIAYRLEMPEGEYTGAFLIGAAQVIGARADLAGQAAAVLPRATRLAEPGTGNLGDVDITPEHTPAVQLLRHVAGTCRLVSELTRAMGETYRLPDVQSRYLGRYRGHPAGWMLHFHLAHTPAMKNGVAGLFIGACQAVMLQVLRASRTEIELRLDHFDEYFEIFSTIFVGLAADEAELRELRDTLLAVQVQLDTSLQSAVSATYGNWRAARQAFSSALSDQILNASEVLDGPDFQRGVPGRRADGTYVVRDARGREWTMQDLETAIALRNGTASSIDPLIQQLTNTPDVVDVFRHRPWLARHYLYQLLSEMRRSNADIEREVSDSAIYAFRSGRIRADLPNRTVPGTSVALQGIHLLAHEALADAFAGDGWYGIGLDSLFGTELGRASFLAFGEFGLVITLSVLCPPAGVALGIAIAEVHGAQASERMAIYRSVMNPEELYSRAELELDLFLAELELVLNVVPELGTLGRGLSRASGTLSRLGPRLAVRHLAVQARRALLRSVAQQLRAGLGRAFVHALVTDRVLTLVLPLVLGPVIEAVQAEIGLRTVEPGDDAAPESPADAAPEPDSNDRPESPQGIEFYARLDEYTPGPDEESRAPAQDQP